MKRTFRSLIALAIAVVTLAACSSSDDAKYVDHGVGSSDHFSN